MTIYHESTPEQNVVLWVAITAQEAYRARHGKYADQWHLLDIKCAMPNFHPDDPNVRPKTADGARWRPRGCKSTYVIATATASSVLIQAVNDSGEVEYIIEQAMTEARKLLPTP